MKNLFMSLALLSSVSSFAGVVADCTLYNGKFDPLKDNKGYVLHEMSLEDDLIEINFFTLPKTNDLFVNVVLGPKNKMYFEIREAATGTKIRQEYVAGKKLNLSLFDKNSRATLVCTSESLPNLFE
jgi:hypothetical protein